LLFIHIKKWNLIKSDLTTKSTKKAQRAQKKIIKIALFVGSVPSLCTLWLNIAVTFENARLLGFQILAKSKN